MIINIDFRWNSGCRSAIVYLSFGNSTNAIVLVDKNFMQMGKFN